ncbi:GNAT family N-acetyltransferase [Lysobacter sp. A6]|uniref:GNAT family N-acetyltransferase n=1 Tax=Noviluteimonas lactosilytica TaxID=2888523 RepID=A0ABS8JEP8_9GAMM|nr:GNAT family N-acetyltransferase [Lysobacter lactosilyticus]MCC8361963.1 GNAT family N-acetyltransferase [Lysobacter lactosilyticus]
MTTVDWTTPPTLRGRHVSLEPLAPSHADGLREAVEDGRLHEIWYTNVPAPADVAAYIDGALSKQAKGEQLAFAVRDADGRVVGTTRYYELTPDVPRLQIGYTWYAASVQRTGLNTEAKLLLLGHAFDVLRCASVGLQTSWFNHVSRTAIARLGAKEEGITRNHVRHRDGTLRDTVNFSIIDAEWPGVKANLAGRLERHA